MSGEEIKVVIADDSGLMRLLITDILNSDPGIKVIDTATDGKEAVERTRVLNPDVLVLDMTMGKYDGLYAVKRIMKERPTPILILSALGNTNMDPIMEALDMGAFDYLSKPVKNKSKIRDITSDIIRKVKLAAKADLGTLSGKKIKINHNPHSFAQKLDYSIIVIGSSTGGPTAIERVITKFPSNMSVPVVIVQHMPSSFVPSFVNRLNTLTPLDVVIGRKDTIVEPGKIIIAPGSRNMILKRNNGSRKVLCDFTRKKYKEYNYPSVNALMLSVAEIYRSKAIGVILTGMGKDGAKGMEAIFQQGGYTVAQDEKSSVVFGMPREVIENGNARQVVSVYEIAGFLISCLS